MLDDTERLLHITLTIGSQDISIAYTQSKNGSPSLLFLHGWGCDNSIFGWLRSNLKDIGMHCSLDFPGFGSSELPSNIWGVEEYADCVNEFINTIAIAPCVCICHSFGGRVALRLAHKNPELINALILISSAGLKRRVPLIRRAKVKSIRTIARLANALIPFGIGQTIKNNLYDKIGSRDYKNAEELRPILVKVVNDDLSDILPNIHIPTLLLYGSEDRETPPEVGKKISKMLPNSTYIELPGFDHLSILNQGRHQLEHQIKQFFKKLEII